MTVVVTLDDALAALAAALAEAGVPQWDPPAADAAVKDLEDEIAPLRLPDAVSEFWRRVDVLTLRVDPYPRFITPAFALEGWRMARDEFRAFQPLALLNVGNESHACMSVELDVGDTQGGALFEWFVSDPSGFDRRFNSFPEWLAHVAGLIARGSYERLDAASGPRLLVPDPEHAGAERATRAAPGPHAVHGTVLHIGGDILEWPQHWQHASGVRPENLELRGATHTVADVLASSPAEELRATIVAEVIDYAGGGSWARVRVRDGTGSLNVYCPPGTTLLGPRNGEWNEFDIVVEPGLRHVPVDPDVAASGVDDEVDRVTAVLMARYGGPAGATARAVRPMRASRT